MTSAHRALFGYEGPTNCLKLVSKGGKHSILHLIFMTLFSVVSVICSALSTNDITD